MKRSFKRKKGPVQSKKITYDGIKFASGLERYMYMALKKAKIKAKYEGQTFELPEPISPKSKNIIYRFIKNIFNQLTFIKKTKKHYIYKINKYYLFKI